jgi:hypothetical protein
MSESQHAGYARKPGGYETSSSGREQDLITPLLQGAALHALAIWTAAWFVAWGIGMGPSSVFIVFFALMAWYIGLWLHRHESIHWLHVIGVLIVGTGIPYVLDQIWIGYILPWSPFFKILWSLFCLPVVACGAIIFKRMYVGLIDPHWPPPRVAVERVGRLRYDSPEIVEPEIEIREIPSREITFERMRESKDLGIDYFGIPDMNTREWHQYIRRMLIDYARPESYDGDVIGWSETIAHDRFGIAEAEYRRVRNAAIDAGLLKWRNPDHKQEGCVFVETELESWIGFASSPPPPRHDWYVQAINEAMIDT